MTPRGTTLRAVRVPAELWDAARRKAQAEGTTLSGIIRAALAAYINNNQEGNHHERP